MQGSINKTISSLPGQFLIGGLTVSGISYVSNILNNPLLGGIIAGIPLGMPSTIFVKDSNVKGYTWNLMIMSTVLLLSTILNWFLINIVRYDKYTSVMISMALWFIVAGSYYLSVR